MIFVRPFLSKVQLNADQKLLGLNLCKLVSPDNMHPRSRVLKEAADYCSATTIQHSFVGVLHLNWRSACAIPIYSVIIKIVLGCV